MSKFPVDEIKGNEIEVNILGLNFVHRTGIKKRKWFFVRKNKKKRSTYSSVNYALYLEVFTLRRICK